MEPPLSASENQTQLKSMFWPKFAKRNGDTAILWPKFANDIKGDGEFSTEMARIEANEPKYRMKRIQTPQPKKVILYDTVAMKKIEFSSCKGE